MIEFDTSRYNGIKNRWDREKKISTHQVEWLLQQASRLADVKSLETTQQTNPFNKLFGEPFKGGMF